MPRIFDHQRVQPEMLTESGEVDDGWIHHVEPHPAIAVAGDQRVDIDQGDVVLGDDAAPDQLTFDRHRGEPIGTVSLHCAVMGGIRG